MDNLDQVLEQKKTEEVISPMQENLEREQARLEERLPENVQRHFEEEPAQEEMQWNEQAAAIARSQLERTHVNAAADGVPAQEYLPARQTYKKRRQRANMDRMVRKKHNRYANADIYDADIELNKRMEKKRAVFKDAELVDRLQKNNVDIRVMSILVQGYETKKDGITPQKGQEDIARRDSALIEAFLSEDVRRRKPYLDDMLEKYLAIDVSEGRYSDAYVRTHIPELKEECDTLVYFDNVMKDPKNREYFDAMPGHLRALIEARRSLYGPLSTLLSSRVLSYGYDVNHAVYMTGEEMEIGAAGVAGQIDIAQQMLHESLLEYQRTLGQLV